MCREGAWAKLGGIQVPFYTGFFTLDIGKDRNEIYI